MKVGIFEFDPTLYVFTLVCNMFFPGILQVVSGVLVIVLQKITTK